MHFRVGWKVATLALVVSSAQPALSQTREDAESYLVAAIGLFAQNEYEEALVLVQKARTRPSEGGADVDASLALWEGLLRLHLGQKEEATPHLLRAFMLRPDMALPARLSPKLKQRVEELRAEAKRQNEKSQAIAATNSNTSRPGTSTPEQQGGEAGKPDTKEKPDKAERPVKTVKVDGPTVETTPTRTGTALTGTPDKPVAGDKEPYLPTAELARSGPSYVAPIVLGGVALGAGAVGAWFGLQSQDAIAQARAERVQLDAADGLLVAKDQALGANLAFAVAGSAALAAVITLLVSR